MIISNVTKKQGFTLSLEDSLLEIPPGEGGEGELTLPQPF